MGQRRMFSLKIINSARFLKMPIDSQNLYFHLGLHADDDGIVEAYPVMKALGSNEDNLKVLVAKNLIKILNEDLVSFITDWQEHNLIRADRKVDSIYKDLLLKIVPEADLLEPKPRADTKQLTGGRPMDDKCPPKLSKDKLSKDNIDIGAGKAVASIKELFENEITILPTNPNYLLLQEEKSKFLDYWAEKSPNGKKERWQMERVFDIKKRWGRWIRNVEARMKPKEYPKEKDSGPRGGGMIPIGEILTKK